MSTPLNDPNQGQQDGYQQPVQAQQTISHKEAKANAKASKAYAKASRPWYMKKRFWLLGLLALIIIGSIMAKGGGSSDNKSTPSTSQSAGDNKSSATTSDPAAKLTAVQKNARKSAENYLSTMPFSKDGLIQQLSSDAGDKFSAADATAAVNTLDTNWNEQAAKAAKNYMKIQPMSCDGLIQQLSSTAGDKYTTDQATYGAKQTSACAK